MSACIFYLYQVLLIWTGIFGMYSFLLFNFGDKGQTMEFGGFLGGGGVGG